MLAGRRDRSTFLDWVRVIAIATVCLHHFTNRFGSFANDPGPIPEGVLWIVRRFYIGVDLFFVLSGWLIGGQLLRLVVSERRLSVGQMKAFWIRRWMRTLPAYWVALGISFVLEDDNPFSPDTVAQMLVFVQNYTNPFAWGISWSLCIEEHFYLALPIILVLVRLRRGLAIVAGGLLVVLVASPIVRWVAYTQLADKGDRDAILSLLVFRTHVHLDGLAAGVLLALAYETRSSLWAFLDRHRRAFAIAGAVLLLLHFNPLVPTSNWTFRATFFYGVFDFWVVAIGTVLIFPFGLALANRPAPVSAWISDHAYALYLTHLFVIDWIGKQSWLPSNYGIAALVVMPLVLAPAVLLRALVERPGLYVRDLMLARMSTRE